jgi:hypothetical protein
LDVNKDQLAKRQKLIGDIEAALTRKYNKPNRMIDLWVYRPQVRGIAHNYFVGDLPLNFHPAATRASAVDTPFGAV